MNTGEFQMNLGFFGNKKSQIPNLMKTPPRSWGKGQALETLVSINHYVRITLIIQLNLFIGGRKKQFTTQSIYRIIIDMRKSAFFLNVVFIVTEPGNR